MRYTPGAVVRRRTKSFGSKGAASTAAGPPAVASAGVVSEGSCPEASLARGWVMALLAHRQPLHAAGVRLDPQHFVRGAVGQPQGTLAGGQRGGLLQAVVQLE